MDNVTVKYEKTGGKQTNWLKRYGTNKCTVQCPLSGGGGGGRGWMDTGFACKQKNNTQDRANTVRNNSKRKKIQQMYITITITIYK